MSSVQDLDLRRNLSKLRADPPDNGFDARLRERVRAALAQRAQEARLLELHQAPPPRPRSRRGLGVAALAFSLAAAAAVLLQLRPEAGRPQQPAPSALGTPAPAVLQPASTPPERLPPVVEAPQGPLPPVPTARPTPEPARQAPRSLAPPSRPAPARALVPRVEAAPPARFSMPAPGADTRSGSAAPLRAIPRVDISDPPARPLPSGDAARREVPDRSGSTRPLPDKDARGGADASKARSTARRPGSAPLRERVGAEREPRGGPRLELQDRQGPQLEREPRGRGRR